MAAELDDLRRQSGFGSSSKIDNLGYPEFSGPAAPLLLQTKRQKNTNASAVVPSKRGHEEDSVTVVPSKKSKDGSSPGCIALVLQDKDKGKGRAVSSLPDLIGDNSPKPQHIKEEEPGEGKTSGSAGPDGQNSATSVVPDRGALASTPAAPSTSSEPVVLSSGPASAPSMPAATERTVGGPKRRPRRKIDQWPPSEDTEGAQWAYAREWYAKTAGTQYDFVKHYSEIPERQKNKLRRVYNSKKNCA
ncbi:hypothetical protein K466DRAFT_581491 [Polyporus arcularius HHB13444]|uniref:Uncharacterized protein n=1 Tax=Polyporus arcularius HHB13444 TaxID=1314778 RepID=A0A5C3PW25_9APHY|nr:hypothetical protein K466DRAFT_581491 [Polyporus arcularius HHB13444]